MNNYTKEELELMNYDDIAYLILKDKKEKMKLHDLFKEICSLLELDEKLFEEKIVDFFELLSTDKRFIMLENGFWDLRDNHSHKISIETEEDNEEDLDEESAIEEDNYDDEDEEDIDDEELKELVIIDEDEIEKEI